LPTKLLETTEGAAHRTTGQQGSEEKAENVKDSSRKIKKNENLVAISF
jgi:hypothetical protein